MGLEVTQERKDGQVEFRVDGALFTRYIYGDDTAARPYFYPLIGPTGEGLTRNFPMDPKPDEPTDHPHHRSLWTAHGSINGHDNWNLPAKHGRTVFQSLEPQTSPDLLTALSDITDFDGNLLCQERLTVQVLPAENGAHLLDWKVTLTAPEGTPVVLGDTKEVGMCAVRVAASLQGDRGGRIENAEGGVGEKECWGKPSRWCDYSGALTPGGEIVGVAILCHPDSFRHPTPWHTRAYGLHAANPFGLSYFTNGAENGEYTIPAGGSLDFHYAVLPHRGTVEEAGVEARWQEWSQSA